MLMHAEALKGYKLLRLDREIGKVKDLYFDDQRRNWASWNEEKAFVNLSRETIKRSNEYTKEALPTRDYEIDLRRHYRRQGYWISEKGSNEKRDLYDEL